jgi:hypothetical protein
MYLTQVILAVLFIIVQSEVVINPISGIATRNLMYTGTIAVGT